ncbi:hypothetical protein BDK51DRAFT_26400, partial [Blyttiomyces helicus]
MGVQRVTGMNRRGSAVGDLSSVPAPLLASIALSGAPAGVKVFGEETTIYWREMASGHSRIGYFLGKTLATLYRFTLSAYHFTAIYYFLAVPRMAFAMQFAIVFLQYFGVYGMAAVISTLVRRENAALLAVVIGMFAAVFCGYGPTVAQAKSSGFFFILAVSFNMWASEAAYSESLTPYAGVYDLSFATNTS